MTLDDALTIGRLDAHDQAALVRSREASAAELVESAIQRAQALDPALDAITETAFDMARERAAGGLPDGPMAGVPWLIKDSLDYPGLPSRAGSRSRSGDPVDREYPFTRIWDAEGLIPLGKSAMPEFGLLPTTEPLLRAPTRNPWSLEHSPGGSSGGAAAALAVGIVPLAHGSDGAGSIRIPASCCGVVGLKPGRGASVRVRGRSVIEDLIVSDVLMSRSVRDTAWAFAAAHPDRPAMVRGPSGGRLRIAFNLDTLDGGPTDPGVAQVAQRIASLCEDLGHIVEPASPDIDRPAALEGMHVLWAHDGADCVDGVRGSGRDPASVLEPWTLALGEMAERLEPADLERALGQAARLPAQFRDFHGRYDVMLTPTLAAPPLKLGEMTATDAPEGLLRRFFEWVGYTPLQNIAGTPAISLPMGWSDEGLPIGVMLAGDRGAEDVLLGLAYELEAAQPWADRWPEGARHVSGS